MYVCVCIRTNKYKGNRFCTCPVKGTILHNRYIVDLKSSFFLQLCMKFDLQKAWDKSIDHIFCLCRVCTSRVHVHVYMHNLWCVGRYTKARYTGDSYKPFTNERGMIMDSKRVDRSNKIFRSFLCWSSLLNDHFCHCNHHHRMECVLYVFCYFFKCMLWIEIR